MAIGIENFSNALRSASATSTIVLGSGGKSVKSQGSVGTFFTMKATARATTQAFLDSYRAAYGSYLGDKAQTMLQESIDAGKPLQASVVRQILDMSAKEANKIMMLAEATAPNQYACKQIVDYFESFNSDRFEMTDAQKNAAVGLVSHAMPDLAETILSKGDHKSFVAKVAREVCEMKSPLLKVGLEMILNAPGSKYAALGSPADCLNAKLDALACMTQHGKLLVNLDKYEDRELAKQLLYAACELKKNGNTVNIMNLYENVFPRNVFTEDLCAEFGISRPSNEELAHMRPDEFIARMREDCGKLTDETMNEKLPVGSPFKYFSGSKSGVLMAQCSMMPAQILSETSARPITLADVPLIQADISLHEKYPNAQAAIDMFNKDVECLGSSGYVDDTPSPSWKFTANNGTELCAFKLGYGDYTVNADSAKARASELVARVAKCSYSAAQNTAIMACLTQSGIYPLRNVVQSMGDFCDISEHSHYDYEIREQPGCSVNVTISIGAELEAVNGSGSLTYSIAANGAVEIADFKWEPPNPRTAFDYFVNSTENLYGTLTNQIRKKGYPDDETCDIALDISRARLVSQYGGLPDDQLPSVSRMINDIKNQENVSDTDIMEFTLLTTMGLSRESAAAAIVKGDAFDHITLDDFSHSFRHDFDMRTPDIEAAAYQLIRDFYRTAAKVEMLDETGAVGQTFDLAPLKGNGDEAARRRNKGEPNPVFDDILDNINRLCGGNKAQMKGVYDSMHQAGLSPILAGLHRFTTPGDSNAKSKMSEANYSIRKDSDGSVLVRRDCMEGCPNPYHFTYRISTDGIIDMVDFDARRGEN